jgi:hypothetical protein
MEAFLLLIIAQLSSFARGHFDGSEFGRHRIDTNSPRRNRLVVLDNVAGKRQIRQKKLSNWSTEERYEWLSALRSITENSP